MDWSNLSVFLAVVRGGSTRAAASALQTSRSTVARRLERLQAEAGAVLLETTPVGISLTAVGEALVPIAERMEEEVLFAERLFAAEDSVLRGRIDLTLFDPMTRVLAPVFRDFCAEHPNVELCLSASNELRSLRRREADLAIRATDQPDETLFGRRLGRMEYAIYGLPEVCAQPNPPWVMWDERAGATGTWDLARQVGDPLQVAIRVDDFPSLLAATRSGMGVTLLPVVLGTTVPGLVPFGTVPQPAAGIDVWVLTHPDLRRSARVRALMGALGEGAGRLLA